MILFGEDEAPRLERAGLLGFGAIALSLLIVFAVSEPQSLCGDETRYLMYARSIWEHGRYVMTLPEWQSLYHGLTGGTMNELPADPGRGPLMNSVYLSTILSPVAEAFSLPGLRLVTLFAGIAGLFFLFRLCRRVASTTTALVAVAVVAYSIPLLPFLHLYYMETFLFALVCCVWDRLQKTDRGIGGDLATAALTAIMPVVHIRGSGVAAAFFSMLLWRQYTRGRKRFAAMLLGLAMLAAVAFFALNLAIYRAPLGPVNDARPPAPWDSFAMLSMQSFNIAHGLIAFAPVWILGFAGLWGGAFREVPLARQGLILAAIAELTAITAFPGGTWPARYWIQSIPMLAVGLCVLWQMQRSTLVRGIAVFVIAATLVNTVLFFQSSILFLQNRQSTATYQRLFDEVGIFHFGLVLPTEAPVNDLVDIVDARNLAIAAAIFILCLALALARRRSLYAAPAVLLILAALDLSRASVVPAADYTMEETPHGFDVTPRAPVASGYVAFGHYDEAWFMAPDWPRFTTTLVGASGEVRRSTRANQVIPAACSDAVRHIVVEGPPSFDFPGQIKASFRVYRSDSLLRNGIGWFREKC
jgi:hypothetical protein